MGGGDWSQMRDDEGLTAVVVSAFRLHVVLMILTAFMSLAQLEMGSNDAEIDQVDHSHLIRSINKCSGWFVPSDDGGYDHTNSTMDWHLQPASMLEQGRVQTGLMLNNQLDIERCQSLKRHALQFLTGFGIIDDLTAHLRISIQSSDDDAGGLELFEGGASLNNTRILQQPPVLCEWARNWH